MDFDNQATEHCTTFERYNIKERSFGPLRVVCYENKWIILWNRFTIIVKEINNLNETHIIHNPETLIRNICIVRNIFLYVDYDNNVFFNTLKKSENDKLLEKLNCKHIKYACCNIGQSKHPYRFLLLSSIRVYCSPPRIFLQSKLLFHCKTTSFC